MIRAVFGGHAAKTYPEIRMLSADTGEQAVIAEPGLSYDFPDVVVTTVGDDGMVSTDQVPFDLPQDGLWLPEGTKFTPTVVAEDSPQEEGPAPGQGTPAKAASGPVAGSAGKPGAGPPPSGQPLVELPPAGSTED